MNRSFRLMLSRIAFMTLLATAFGPLPAPAQDDDNYGTTEMGDQPTYPGIPPKGKVEGTLGNYNFRFYGTALLNIHASDAPNVGGEVPLWALPGAGRTTFIDGSSERTSDVHDLIFTARQTILGFMVKPSTQPINGRHPPKVVMREVVKGVRNFTLSPTFSRAKASYSLLRWQCRARPARM
jgi:hypothetical protein